jgi:hypothetical protein
MKHMPTVSVKNFLGCLGLPGALAAARTLVRGRAHARPARSTTYLIIFAPESSYTLFRYAMPIRRRSPSLNVTVSV